MWKEILLLFLTVGTALTELKSRPYTIPTEGLIWPTPRERNIGPTSFTVQSEFDFSIGGYTCDILEEALTRYKEIIFPSGHKSRPERGTTVGDDNDDPSVDTLATLNVVLNRECEIFPYLEMDENYEIEITSTDNDASGILRSESIWGILRGLESFSQILIPTESSTSYSVNETFIGDGPRFAHRGLMIDTSRHFLPVGVIYRALDLLSMNKFNVLHWHMVDTESFPYVSEAFPDMSLAAYTQDRVYTALDMADVVDYARLRGIRIVTEFDTPGHTQSWYEQPGLLTPCYWGPDPSGELGPIDPSNEDNYEFLESLFTEITQRFPDHYVHLGGDEVGFGCWESNPNITEFMEQHNMTGDYSKLEEYYITRLTDIISNLPTNNGYVVWQEVFDNGVKIAPDTVVEIWMGGWEDEIARVTEAGFKAILSSCWYLNYISYGPDWKNYYQCEPLNFEGTEAQKALVQGGEACMWGEFVDKTNLISRTFPRASAVGEKLWSPQDKTTDVDSAVPRIEELRCKLLSRGYNVEPLGQSYCPGDNIF